MTRTTYQVNEIFDSLQGEGVWTGMPATFIRLQGCSVGCPWCDSGPMADVAWGRHTNGLTRNTWGKGGVQMSLDQIIDKIHRRFVIITGGEPTLYNLDSLLLAIGSMDIRRFTQVETSGQQWFKGKVLPDWITWSPKPALRWAAPVEFYEKANEIKWVVEPTLQFETVLYTSQISSEMGNHKVSASLMPEGVPPRKSNIDLAIEYTTRLLDAGFGARYSDRLQYRLGIR